jgi:UDP-glucuronate decarboxylase
MRYLIAGGAGFIGSNLCATLVDQGHSVICVDNLSTGRLSNIEMLLRHERFAFIEHDVISGVGHIPEVEAVLHLASPASPPGYQRLALETMRVNSEGTMHLLEFARSHSIPFTYVSTSEAYGDPLVHPQNEDYRGNVSSIGPRSMYDEAKRYGEALTMVYSRSRDVDARIVRVFNTYGPNSDPEDGRMVPNLITQAIRNQPLTIYGDGQQTRSLCYVSDLVDGLLKVTHSQRARGDVINLGNPEEHTISDFATIIRELCDSHSELVFCPPPVGDDPQRRKPDIKKAQTTLGWEPLVPLRTGLGLTIDYFRRELEKDTNCI